MTTAKAAAGRPARQARPAAGRGGAGALLLACLTTGCYAYTPLRASPTPGSRVALELNDRGRVALGDSVGESADRIEGRVQVSSDSSYVLRVSSVRYTNGQTNAWTNEPLTVRADLVRTVAERRLSRGRTFAAVGSTVAIVVGFVLSRDLLGIGNGSGRQGGDDGGGPDQ